MVVIQQINIKAEVKKTKKRKAGELKTLETAPAKYRDLYKLDGLKIVIPNIKKYF